MKHRLNYLFVRILCYSNVYKMSACSMVLWYSLNPACVGAWRLSAFA